MKYFLLIPALILAGKLSAQHHHEHAPAKTDTMQNEHEHKTVRPDSIHMHHNMDDMTSAFSNNLPMNRDGSGTAWQPDATPMMMHMMMKGKNSLMVHGSAFIRYNMQDLTKESKRGGNKFDIPNMFMVLASHKPNDKNLLSFLSMISLDPFTVGSAGYPLLFQTGESYKGVPLVDKQHPHDLFSELAVNYTHGFNKAVDLNTYLGYPGEPALGPSTFMHRASAQNIPDAPLGHHWQDATHITFGVGTLGLRYRNLKAEGSIFTGREPGENRYDFDSPRFDSYSYRLSYNPNKYLALQASQGFIKSPEALFPDENIVRTTASVMHNMPFNHSGHISTTLVWGMNSTEEKSLSSFLIETNVSLHPFSVYGRYEFVQKDAHELHLLEFEHGAFDIQAFTLGINMIVFPHYIAHLSAGVQGTINFPDARLKSIYGNTPLAAEVFLKISPPQGHVHGH